MDYREIQKKTPHIFSNEDAVLKIVTDEKSIRDWVDEKKKSLASKGLPERWAEIGVVYEDPFITILRDLVKFPSGRLGSYFRILNSADLQGGHPTVILPIIQSKILLMHQFRHPTRKWHWEVPRGFGEPDTPPEENARKEILEEINGEVIELVDLGKYNSNTGIEGAEVQLFLAYLEFAGETNQDEGIESYKLVEVKEMEDMIRNSEITDGFTIAAFTRARLLGLL